MSINAYVGLQGSGKSYEFVSGPMLDAVLAGRRVVTNVAGISEELVHDYLVDKRDAARSQLGPIVHVTNDQILQPQFFPDEEKPELQTVVRGGDLVAIDEAWRFWGADSGKLSHEHMQFFRMHRHYVHPETAVACDVVLMTQDITGLHRSVKNVIEFAFRMQKHKALGFTSRYRVEIYEGSKLNAKTRIDDRQKKYNSEIFPLYQSYTGGKGLEAAIDKRQNILANRALWAYGGATLLFMSIGAWSTYSFFTRDPASEENRRLAKQVRSKSGVGSSPVVSQQPRSVVGSANYSEKWRYAGEFTASGERWVLVADTAGRIRVESPSAFHGAGLAVIGNIDGETVARWTGSENSGGSNAVSSVPSAVVQVPK